MIEAAQHRRCRVVDEVPPAGVGRPCDRVPGHGGSQSTSGLRADTCAVRVEFAETGGKRLAWPARCRRNAITMAIKAPVYSRVNPPSAATCSVPEKVDQRSGWQRGSRASRRNRRADPDEDPDQAEFFLVKVEREKLDPVVERTNQVLAHRTQSMQKSGRFASVAPWT